MSTPSRDPRRGRVESLVPLSLVSRSVVRGRRRGFRHQGDSASWGLRPPEYRHQGGFGLAGGFGLRNSAMKGDSASLGAWVWPPKYRHHSALGATSFSSRSIIRPALGARGASARGSRQGGLPPEGLPSGGLPPGDLPSGGLSPGGVSARGTTARRLPTGGLPSGGLPLVETLPV
jgi:hypothetical protein